ncbi:inositol 3-alpha-galactosyltransferase [Marchantia polymorpha subsp. ruderalis]
MVSRSAAVLGMCLAAVVAFRWSAEMAERRPVHKRVWMVQLSSDEYLPGVLTLDFSMKKVASKYALVVMHPRDALSDATMAALRRRGIATKAITMLRAAKTYTGFDARFNHAWTKLLPHGMTEYDRVVELDADMVALQNADELMEMRLEPATMAATHACVCNPKQLAHYPANFRPENCAYTAQHARPATAHLPEHAVPGRFGLALPNGGLQVIDPDAGTFRRLLAVLANATLVASFSHAEQNALRLVFAGRWVALPWVYNGLYTMREAHQPIWNDSLVKIVHYIIEKPWDDALQEHSHLETYRWWWRLQKERLRFEQNMAAAV